MSKGVLVLVGDSLSVGYNSVATSTPPFGPFGRPGVLVYDRWLSNSVSEKLGILPGASQFGWSPLPYASSNYQSHGPSPAYFLANAIHRFLDLDELRVITMGVPQSDVVQFPTNNNYGATWAPLDVAPGIFERFSRYHIGEAMATGDLSGSVYLGTFASLGNNMTNTATWPEDQTNQLAANLDSLFDSVERAILPAGQTSRRIVTRVPLEVLNIINTVEFDRIRSVYRQLTRWRISGPTDPRYRQIADLSNIPFLGVGNAHYNDTGTMRLGNQLYKAWLSSPFTSSQGPFIP